MPSSPVGLNITQLRISPARSHRIKEHYAFLSVSELPEFFRVFNTYTGNQIVKLAMRLLIITGTRPGELRKAEWSEFDFDKRLWEVPPERMKKRRPHCVPLSDQAISILEQLKPLTGHYSYVFPGRIHHSKPISEMAMNVLVRRIGYAGRVTGHGFRHTMSTILHEQGITPLGLKPNWLTWIRTAFVEPTTMPSIWMAGGRCFNGMQTTWTPWRKAKMSYTAHLDYEHNWMHRQL